MKGITNRNDKGLYHGYIELYWRDGELRFKCFFNNGIKVDYQEYYSWHNGKLKSKIFHI